MTTVCGKDLLAIYKAQVSMYSARVALGRLVEEHRACY